MGAVSKALESFLPVDNFDLGKGSPGLLASRISGGWQGGFWNLGWLGVIHFSCIFIRPYIFTKGFQTCSFL